MNKITKREVLKMILDVCKENKIIVDYANKELSLLDKKKNYVSPKNLQKEKENEIIKKLLLLSLDEKPKTIKELINLNSELSNYSSQRLSSVIKTIDNITIEKDRVFRYAIFPL